MKKKIIFLLFALWYLVGCSGVSVTSSRNSSFDSTVSTGELTYAETIFKKDQIMEINISITDANWQTLIDTAGEDTYVESVVTINGVNYPGVGIRAKGNSSLLEIDRDPSSDRFSFRLNAEKFSEGQRFDGLKFMVLNNGFSDMSYLKEYLSYTLFAEMGVKTPAFAFARVTKNNQPWGLYTAVEVIDDDFLERTYGTNYGHLYKPEVEAIVNGQKVTYGDRGADLVYIDDNVSSYVGIFEDVKTKFTTITDHQRIVTALKNLSLSQQLDTSFNIDQWLRLLAVNTALVNLDSYAGNLKHNYYLYENNGPIEVIPWDLNMSFGGYRMDSSSQVINFPIDAPYIDTAANTPLIAKILAISDYRTLYHTYLSELMENYFANGSLTNQINQLDTLIRNDVQNDATALYSYSNYQAAINQLKIFVSDRQRSIQAQLNGTQPTQSYGSITTTFNNALLVSLPSRPPR